MDLLEYWKEIGLGLLGLLTVLSNISEKFRNTIRFWKTKKYDEKKQKLDVFKALEDYQQKKIKELIDDLETESIRFTKKIESLEAVLDEKDRLIEVSNSNNAKQKAINKKLLAHIRYIEGILTRKKIEFDKIEIN